MIKLPNFSEHGEITPNIVWQGSTLVNEDGSTNRPAFSESPTKFMATTVTAQLTHPTSPTISLEATYTIKIKRLAGTPEEMANAALIEAKESFQEYFTTRKNVRNSIIHPDLPDGVSIEWIN